MIAQKALPLRQSGIPAKDLGCSRQLRKSLRYPHR
jgi:hypothetical protein